MTEVKPISFVEAVKLFFTRYTDFKGRSRRSEYWWASLATTIISGVLSSVIPNFAWIWTLVILVPSVAICLRRLHDIGKSGWWYLINLIPVIGQIIFLIFMLKDSAADNQWGPNPKA